MPFFDGWHYERAARKRGFAIVAGVDEAGRGPLAGPVVAACVVLPFEKNLNGIGDSKKLSPAKREAAFVLIQQESLGIGIASAEPEEIDRLNILRATQRAMATAVERCAIQADFVLVDGRSVPTIRQRQLAIVKGDALSYSIGAASIVAKVTRDRIMMQLAEIYPGYGFEEHKGYPTPSHLAVLRRLGPSPIHRHSFQPVREASLASGETKKEPPLLFDSEEIRRLGDTGERIAERHAEILGWRVLGRRFRCPEGEIDLVALDGSTLVFAEVKTSDTSTLAADRVDAPKQSRLRRAAEVYLAALEEMPATCRFDILEVIRNQRGLYSVRHHRDAF